MKSKVEKLNEKCEIRYNVVAEGKEWKDAQDKAVAALVQNVTVKGFRKGKAPLAQAARQLSPNDILDKAADKIVKAAYAEMLNNTEIRPIFQPELVVNEFNAEKLSFSFVVVTSPVVELKEYKGLEVEKKAVKVTKKEVEEELKALATKNAELVVANLETPAELGDTVVIDFKGFVDGVAFDGGEASSFELELGSNTFVPGFEDQLVGVKTMEDKDVVLTFPENYVAGLAGKEATFKVHVTSIKHKVIPEINDDFAKDLDIKGVETLEQLQEHTKLQIKERKEKLAENEQFETLLTRIEEDATFLCHNKILKEDADRIVEDFKKRLEQQGFDLADYLKMSGKTMEQINEEAMAEATRNTKRACVLDKVAELEKISVTDEELDTKLEELGKQYNMTLEDVKKQLGDRTSSFKYNLRQEKVVELLKKSNNLL